MRIKKNYDNLFVIFISMTELIFEQLEIKRTIYSTLKMQSDLHHNVRILSSHFSQSIVDIWNHWRQRISRDKQTLAIAEY